MGDRLKSHGNGIPSEARGAGALFAWLKRTGVPLPKKWLGGYAVETDNCLYYADGRAEVAYQVATGMEPALPFAKGVEGLTCNSSHKKLTALS